MRWDICCEVIDHYGDVAWALRFARSLHSLGAQVRVIVRPCPALAHLLGTQSALWPMMHEGLLFVDWSQVYTASEYVCQAFLSPLPERYQAAMRIAGSRLFAVDYLSFESWTADCHQRSLLSPVPGYFWSHGPYGGGVLREPWYDRAQAAHDRRRFLAAQGVCLAPDEQLCFVFAYVCLETQQWLSSLAERRGWVLVLPELLVTLITSLPGVLPTTFGYHYQHLRIYVVPFLPQSLFDRWLWSADLVLVRGEDSCVRALLSGCPCLWQLYPQEPVVRLTKLRAFIRYLYEMTGYDGHAALLGLLNADQDMGSYSLAWERVFSSWSFWQRAAAQLAAHWRKVPDLLTQLICCI